MFRQTGSTGYTEIIKGIHLKTMVCGEKTLLTEIRLEKGAIIPVHQHPYEQTGYLVSGRMDFLVNGIHQTAEPGDSWSIGENIPHGATILEESVVVEVFSPVREDYLPYYKPDH